MNKFLLVLAFISSSCLAHWQADLEKSSISFVSTKQIHIHEVHEVTQFDVSVSEQQIEVALDLSSVETGIPIRNERMRSMLFDMANFKTAVLRFSMPKTLDSITQPERITVDAELSLHGKTNKIQLDLLLSPTENGVIGSLLKPVLISASAYGLQEGIDALKTVAGLSSIAYTVPVYATINLVNNK